jgi:uncharacterized protein YutE (UPF0331/DUF86 family)
MDTDEKKKLLENYFTARSDVLMAFIFGSRAKALARLPADDRLASSISDWDVAVYLKPLSPEIECEQAPPSAGQDCRYPQESVIWGDICDILKTDYVDLVILNCAPANIAASAIQGMPVVIKDRKVYLEFMLSVTREAEDYRQTAREYAEVYWRSASLSREDADVLNRRLIFLDSELRDACQFQGLTREEYERDSRKRREVERWIENLMNAAIDISKIILASEKRPIPSTYRETLWMMGTLPDFPGALGEQLAQWAELRNILAHEYLDIRWRRIENFVKTSLPYFRQFIDGVRGRL